jgi:hypothetical protein
MPSESYEDIIAKHPRDAAVLRRLEALTVAHHGRAEYTAHRLFDLVKPRTLDDLVFLLDDLVRAGLFQRFFRVESPIGGEAARFENFVDVPPSFLDLRSGTEIDIEPDSLEVIYRPLR